MSSLQNDAAPQQSLSIGKVSKELGISTATINFYVQQGILPAPIKLSRTRAAYDDRHVRILRIIKRLQGAGFALSHIKQLFEATGYDEDALAKLEGIGYLQPLKPPKLHQSAEPLELFEPVDQDTFTQMSGLTAQQLDELQATGFLRPQHGRYDARDLQLVRTAQLLLRAGIPMSQLTLLAEQLVALMRMVFPMTMLLGAQYMDALRTRELGFRDILEPFLDVIGYFFNRVADAEQPGWRATTFFRSKDEQA